MQQSQQDYVEDVGVGRHAVTAVIVNFNSGALLARCLDDLDRQDVDHVVVVDNASTDDSSRAAEREGVALLRSPRNLGFAGGVNRALSETSDPYVLLLNADVELDTGYVESLAAALDRDPALAGATGILRLSEREIDSTGIELTTARWASDRGRGQPPGLAAVDAPFGVSGAAALLRRTALDEGLWEELFVYWEDVELAWRLRRAGWRFATVTEAHATHARGSDTAAPDFVEAANFSGRLATVARHEGLVGLLRPPALIVSVVVASRLLLRHPRAFWRARPIWAVRAGLRARRGDGSRGWPSLPAPAFSHHPWRPWLTAQLTGRRRGHGARQVRPANGPPVE